MSAEIVSLISAYIIYKLQYFIRRTKSWITIFFYYVDIVNGYILYDVMNLLKSEIFVLVFAPYWAFLKQHALKMVFVPNFLVMQPQCATTKRGKEHLCINNIIILIKVKDKEYLTRVACRKTQLSILTTLDNSTAK